MGLSAAQMYEDAARTATSSRELEANALFKAARRLEACQQDWGADDRDVRLGDALRYNQRLWTFFQAELARADHQLDPSMRQNLLSISVFVDRRTFELMARPDAGGVKALIDINRNIAAGLSARVSGPATPTAASAPDAT